MNRAQLYGLIGSFAACLLVLLLLLFVYIDTPQDADDEGIMVSFGDVEMGAGYGEQQATVSEPVAPPPAPAAPTNSELLTQQDEPSLEEPEQSEADKRRQAEQAELLRRQQQEEQARIEAERKAQEQAEAERKRQEAIDNAAKLGGLFGSNQGSTGSGDTQSDNRQGNPVGQGSSGGHSWSLSGRSLSSTLAQPAYDTNTEGKVVVIIRVNADGRVISTSVGAGTTISDASVRNAAMQAAKTARFSPGTGEVSGSITYNFKLR